MKVLITGGAGFIGSNLARRLLERGDDVVVVDSFTSGFRSNVPPQAQVVESDVRDAHALIRAAAGAEVIYHLAASVGNKRGIDNPSTDAGINVLGTVNVLEAARFAGCRKVVYSSSAAIFGEPRRLPVAADHPPQPLTPYGVSKLAGENYVLSYAKLYDLEAISLRYFNVYGVSQRFDAYGNVVPIFAERIMDRKPLVIYGDGDQTRDFVNVADVVQANVLAGVNRGISGAFNVGSGTATTINELARTMADVAEWDAPIVHERPRLGDVRHSLADISSAGGALGFRPTVDLPSGVGVYLSWLAQSRRA